jgi:hypothetical protein
MQHMQKISDKTEILSTYQKKTTGKEEQVKR